MRTILVIGIGAGNPEHLTIQAIKAMNRASAFFAFDKGAEKSDLIELRREICARYMEDRAYRFVEIENPQRKLGSAGYNAGVNDWHRARAALVKASIERELAGDGCGAFLVWGDPSLYDSTLRILDLILADNPRAFTYDVIPGITAVQALTAAHKTTLNAIGAPVTITTGRRIAGGLPPGQGTTVVMLDDGSGLAAIADEDAHIRWGAYLGTPDEVLIAGRLRDVAGQILATRYSERARKGWIMDTCLIVRDVALKDGSDDGT